MAGNISLNSLLTTGDRAILERKPELQELLKRGSVSLADLQQRARQADQYGDPDVARVLHGLIPKAQMQMLAEPQPRAVPTLQKVATQAKTPTPNLSAGFREVREHGNTAIAKALAGGAESKIMPLMERAFAVACAVDNKSWVLQHGGNVVTRKQAEIVLKNMLAATPSDADRRTLAEYIAGFGTRGYDKLTSGEARSFYAQHLARAVVFSPARATYEIPATEILNFHRANPDPTTGSFASLSVQERIFLLKALIFDKEGFAVITNENGVDEAQLILALYQTTPERDRDLLGDRVGPYLRGLDRLESLHKVKDEVLKIIGPHVHKLASERDMLVLRGLASPRVLDATQPAELTPRMRLEQAAVRTSHYVRQMGYAGVAFQVPEGHGESISPAKLFLIRDDGAREEITGATPLRLDTNDARTVEQVLKSVGDRIKQHLYGSDAPAPLPPPYLHLGATLGLTWRSWNYRAKDNTVAPHATALNPLVGSNKKNPADILRALEARLANMGVPNERLKGLVVEGDCIRMDTRFAELLLTSAPLTPLARAVEFGHFGDPEDQTKLTEESARRNLEDGTDTFRYRDFESRKNEWQFVRWVEGTDGQASVQFAMPYLAYTRLDRVIAEPDADQNVRDISADDVKKALEFRLSSQFEMPADVRQQRDSKGERLLTMPAEEARALLDTTVLRWRTEAPGYDPYNLYIGERIASGVYSQDKFEVERFLTTKGVSKENLRFVEKNNFELALFRHNTYVFISDRGTLGGLDIFTDARARSVSLDEYVSVAPKTGGVSVSKDAPAGGKAMTVRAYLEKYLGIKFSNLPKELQTSLNQAHFHEGFFTQVLGGLPDTMAKLRELDPKKTNNLVLLGHSKGGAEITILGLLLKLAGYNIKRQVTIGSARALDPNAAAAYNQLGLGELHDRVRNGQDIVPWVPPFSGIPGLAPGGYRHVGREIFINQEGRLVTGLPFTDASKALVAGGGNLSLVNDHLDAGYLRNAESNLYSLYLPPDTLPTVESADISWKDEAMAVWRLGLGLWQNRAALLGD